jgi:hypothetical protein
MADTVFLQTKVYNIVFGVASTHAAGYNVVLFGYTGGW